MKKGEKIIVNGREGVVVNSKKDKVLVEVCLTNDRGLKEKRLQWYTKELVSDVYVNNTKAKNVEFGAGKNQNVKETKDKAKRTKDKVKKEKQIQKKDDVSDEKV